MIKSFFVIIIFNSLLMAQYRDFTTQLSSSYNNFLEEALTTRRFKHSDIKPLIDRLKNDTLFTVKQAGQSVQNREIYLISLGTGSTKVFLWSQMHGDESTATMALFDILNFFTQNSQFDDFKKEMLEKLTLYFMPMVNPDGAEVFERRNFYQLDLNRDAVREQSPEARILKSAFDTIKADFGFNLHDQSIYYSAGRTFKSAAVSFLAPAMNYEKSVNSVRKKAMQVIGQMEKVLSDFIPGHIGRYSDDYEPRAFGDNFQTWGTSTILIETGGWKGDPEKQFLRKMNFIALLAAFKSIAEEGYKDEPLKTYEAIPFNEKDNLMNLLLRNIDYTVDGRKIKVDIGINRKEINKDLARSYYSIGSVADLGDLSIFSGYEDYDLSGMEIHPGKTYSQKISSNEELSGLDFPRLYLEGITNIIIDFKPECEYSQFPVNLVYSMKDNKRILIDGPANFYVSRDGMVKYVIVNGFFIETDDPHTEGVNGEVIR